MSLRSEKYFLFNFVIYMLLIHLSVLVLFETLFFCFD